MNSYTAWQKFLFYVTVVLSAWTVYDLIETKFSPRVIASAVGVVFCFIALEILAGINKAKK